MSVPAGISSEGLLWMLALLLLWGEERARRERGRWGSFMDVKSECGLLVLSYDR